MHFVVSGLLTRLIMYDRCKSSLVKDRSMTNSELLDAVLKDDPVVRIENILIKIIQIKRSNN